MSIVSRRSVYASVLDQRRPGSGATVLCLVVGSVCGVALPCVW